MNEKREKITFEIVKNVLQILRRANVDKFVMSTNRCLGQLTHLRIWHDNSGKCSDASWFLDKVLITDLQSGHE